MSDKCAILSDESDKCAILSDESDKSDGSDKSDESDKSDGAEDLLEGIHPAGRSSDAPRQGCLLHSPGVEARSADDPGFSAIRLNIYDPDRVSLPLTIAITSDTLAGSRG